MSRLPAMISCAVALMAAVASAIWFWQQQGVIRKLKSESTGLARSGAGYRPASWALPGLRRPAWSVPMTQSRGREWLYELFTPPVITYNPSARLFGVLTPTPAADPLGGAAVPELIQVKAELFRLQLLGYFGGTAELLGAFSTPGSPETVLARAGHHFDTLGLTLRRLELGKVPAGEDESGPTDGVAACAWLQDDLSGGEVVLDSRSRRFTGRSVATIRLRRGGAVLKDLGEGDSFVCGPATYRLERIQLSPPEVVVVRWDPGWAAQEKRVLRPASRPALPEIRPVSPGARSTAAMAAAGP